MKKFYSIIPLQVSGQLDSYCYQAVGNSKLQMDEIISFPILTAISGYAVPGEAFSVIYVVTDDERTKENESRFLAELKKLCESRGLTAPEIHRIGIGTDDTVAAQAATFQKVIELAAEDDELFACITYGTKPQSQVLLMSVQYAYRLMQNSSISCIVYGQIDRPSKDKSTWKGKVYDMTALVQLDEIVRVLADRGVKNPKPIIDSLLSL